ncbi:hypothetical protein [Egbenema bharatensis]|uniref:hypothetical protein n=1 Tax=Egbenema bharatensis TaxID=3463334 RepID=UPI003A8469C5
MQLKQSVAPFIHSIQSFGIAKLMVLLLLLSGCASVQLPSFFRWSEVDLAIQVEPTNTPGSFSVSGRANLPDDTPITIAAVRYLQLDDRPTNRPQRATASSDSSTDDLLDQDIASEAFTEALTEAIAAENPSSHPSRLTYSILAYQPAIVQRGEWQADVNLWKVAADGRFQEAWQLEQSQVGLSFRPEDNVIFMAILSSADELSRLEQDLSRRGVRFPGGTILSTSEGFRYAQIQQTLAVALPSGRTTPPPQRPEDRNGGWGDRYIIPNEPPNPTDLEFPGTRITDAPPSPEEFLR